MPVGGNTGSSFYPVIPADSSEIASQELKKDQQSRAQVRIAAFFYS